MWLSTVPRKLEAEKEQRVLWHVVLLEQKSGTVLVPWVPGEAQDGSSCEICETTVSERMVQSHHLTKKGSINQDAGISIEGKAKNQRSRLGSSIDVKNAWGQYISQARVGNTDMLDVESA